MPQLFGPSANVIARASIPGLLLVTIGGTVALMLFDSSSYGTGAGVAVDQPVPFSHEHHVGQLGIDCRYCHTSVESSTFAGMPSTAICMNCHSQMWTASEMLEPVRESFRQGRPIVWQRVYNLPDFVYFNHQIHIQKGVGCTTCHGQIDQMPLTSQVPSLLMGWCIECHRDPADKLRPRDEVFSVTYRPSADPAGQGEDLMTEYHIRSQDYLTSCSICHR